MSDIGNEGGVFEIPRPTDLLTTSGPLILPAKEIVLPKSTYHLLTVDEVFAMPDPKWLAKDLIRVGELGALYGPPGCGKTFVALDLVLSIALGLPWWGHRTTKGKVVYLAGEGARGLKRRIQAWANEHNVDRRTLDLRVLAHSIRFLDQTEFARLLETLKQLDVQPIVIVIDTLARYFDGEENSAQEMGRFIALATALRDVTGATIILVHHEGKNQRGLRGSSALHGAADVVIQVFREGEHVVVLGEKSKDDTPLAAHYFTTKYIDLGIDDDGDPVGSLVLERSVAPPQENAAPAIEFETTPAEKPDHGASIRHRLATMFNGRAAGGALCKASGLKETTYYDALGVEIEADRIRTDGKGRYPFYVLTPNAPEYASPSPSPSPEHTTDPDSGASELRESESESDTPLLGVSAESNSNSRRKHPTASPPHQKKKRARGAATAGRKRARRKAAASDAPASEPKGGCPPKSDAARGGL